MRRPAIPFATALVLAIAGVRAGLVFPVIGLAAAALAVAAALCLTRRRAALVAVPVLAVATCGLAAGFVVSFRHYRVFPDDHVKTRLAEDLAAAPRSATPSAEPAQDATLVGRIVDEPLFREIDRTRYTSLRVDLETLGRDDAPRPTCGRVLVYLWRDQPLDLCYGDRIRVSGTLAAPRGPTNPGESDRRAALADERIYGIFSVAKGDGIEVLARESGTLMGAVLALKARLRRAVVEAVPGEPGALLDSILLGTRTVLRPEVVEDFRRTGTIHMLVVSGFHVSLLIALLWVVLGRVLRLRAWAAIPALLALITLYCLLTGAEPSILRSTIMAAILLVARLLRREPDTLNSLALAGTAILVASPGSLANLGFQLSFTAILGLELIARPMGHALLAVLPRARARAGIPRRIAIRGLTWAGGAAVATFAAWLSTEPIILWQCHLVTPGIIISNLAVGVVCATVLYSGFALMIVAPISTTVAAPIAWFAGLAARALIDLEHALAHAPGMYVYVPDVPGWRVAAAYASLGGAALALTAAVAERLSARARGALCAACIAASALLMLPAAPAPIGPGAASLAVLEVGTGVTSVLRTDATTVLFDCGGGRLETGTRVTAPFLWREGLRRIDAVFLSHAHTDHYDGLVDIADRFSIGRVYVGEWFEDEIGGRRLLADLRERRIPVEVVQAGRCVTIGDDTTVEVLAPCARRAAPAPRRPERGEERLPRYATQNDSSLVLRASVAGRRILLPGDIEGDGVALLAGSGKDAGADVTLVPHHGSGRNPCIDQFATMVQARLAICSAKPGFAAPESLDAFRKAGARVVETSSGGAVLVDLSPAGVVARSFAEERGRWEPSLTRAHGAVRGSKPGAHVARPANPEPGGTPTGRARAGHASAAPRAGDRGAPPSSARDDARAGPPRRTGAPSSVVDPSATGREASPPDVPAAAPAKAAPSAIAGRPKRDRARRPASPPEPSPGPSVEPASGAPTRAVAARS